MKIISRDDAIKLGLKNYFTGKPCKHGHISERQVANHVCVTCRNKRQRERARLVRVWSVDGQRRKQARQAAMESGASTYFHGIPCKNGHVAPRQTSNGACTECTYQRNKTDKVKQYKKQHKKDNRDKYLQHQRRRRAENLEEMREYHRNYFQQNKERLVAQSRKRHLERLKEEDEYRDKVKAQRKKWRENNRAYMCQYSNMRSKRVAQATPSWVNVESLLLKYKERETMSRLTGVTHHVDHRVPIKGKNVCGLHVPWNLRVITAEHNLSKHNKWSSE